LNYNFYSLCIRQGLIEKILSEEMTAVSGVKVLRPWTVVDVSMDDEDNSKPLIATLKSRYGELRDVKAQYIVGCDGGRSTIRRALEKYHVKLEGDSHESVWSAIDVVGYVTDFPDIRKLA
jgi:2-polyprenyl-6-methoxyphenol hydroxylase-like FAD-dependent oxidoreductase